MGARVDFLHWQSSYRSSSRFRVKSVGRRYSDSIISKLNYRSYLDAHSLIHKQEAHILQWNARDGATEPLHAIQNRKGCLYDRHLKSGQLFENLIYV